MKDMENLKFNLQNIRQHLFSCLQKVNKNYEIIMIWWRYDNKGVPHKIGWRLFNGKVYIKYRNLN